MKVSSIVIISLAINIFTAFIVYSSEDNKSEDISLFHSNNLNSCIICHAGNSDGGHISADWNSKLTNTAYTPYSSQSLDANIGQPTGSSKMCLSCHDGTIANDEIGGPILNSTGFNNDLRGNHPISFEYNSALALRDGGLHDPISSLSGLGGMIYQDLLVEGKLECISCHDVHNFNNLDNLLVKSNYRSALCLTCHNK